MDAKANKLLWISIGIVFLIVVASRFIPHAPNFSPVGALALFCGAQISNRKLAFLLPMGALILCDLISEIVLAGSGFYHGMAFVYLSFFAVIAIGQFIKRRKNVKNVLFASLAASVIFFIVSNFGIWLNSPFYTQDFAGLALNYTGAIPFFRNTLLSDLLFNALFFGAFYLSSRKLGITKTA